MNALPHIRRSMRSNITIKLYFGTNLMYRASRHIQKTRYSKKSSKRNVTLNIIVKHVRNPFVKSVQGPRISSMEEAANTAKEQLIYEHRHILQVLEMRKQE